MGPVVTVYDYFTEFIIELSEDTLTTLHQDRRVTAIENKTHSKVVITRRTLNRKHCGDYWMKYIILRIYGEDNSSISSCATLLKNGVPGLLNLKPYDKKASVKVSSTKFTPDNAKLYFGYQRLRRSSPYFAGLWLTSPYQPSSSRPLDSTPWKSSHLDVIGNVHPDLANKETMVQHYLGPSSLIDADHLSHRWDNDVSGMIADFDATSQQFTKNCHVPRELQKPEMTGRSYSSSPRGHSSMHGKGIEKQGAFSPFNIHRRTLSMPRVYEYEWGDANQSKESETVTCNSSSFGLQPGKYFNWNQHNARQSGEYQSMCELLRTQSQQHLTQVVNKCNRGGLRKKYVQYVLQPRAYQRHCPEESLRLDRISTKREAFQGRDSQRSENPELISPHVSKFTKEPQSDGEHQRYAEPEHRSHSPEQAQIESQERFPCSPNRPLETKDLLVETKRRLYEGSQSGDNQRVCLSKDFSQEENPFVLRRSARKASNASEAQDDRCVAVVGDTAGGDPQQNDKQDNSYSIGSSGLMNEELEDNIKTETISKCETLRTADGISPIDFLKGKYPEVFSDILLSINRLYDRDDRQVRRFESTSNDEQSAEDDSASLRSIHSLLSEEMKISLINELNCPSAVEHEDGDSASPDNDKASSGSPVSTLKSSTEVGTSCIKSQTQETSEAKLKEETQTSPVETPQKRSVCYFFHRSPSRPSGERITERAENLVTSNDCNHVTRRTETIRERCPQAPAPKDEGNHVTQTIREPRTEAIRERCHQTSASKNDGNHVTQRTEAIRERCPHAPAPKDDGKEEPSKSDSVDVVDIDSLSELQLSYKAMKEIFYRQIFDNFPKK